MVPPKGLITRNTNVKYQSFSTHFSKVINKVKVFKKWIKLQGQGHIIISPWKRAGRFIWTNLNPNYSRIYFVPSLVEIGPLVLEKKKKKMWKCLQRRQRRRTRLNWAFGLGELTKKFLLQYCYLLILHPYLVKEGVKPPSPLKGDLCRG